MTYAHTHRSPVGDLLLLSQGGALTGLYLGGRAAPADAVADAGPFARVIDELDAYFAGVLTAFTVSLAPRGTPFQLAVWDALRGIPFGATISYGEQARRIGRPSASRAVGAANGKNPLSIIVPCHRVIGTAGTLTGYGGGLDRKRWLLDFETAAARVPA